MTSEGRGLGAGAQGRGGAGGAGGRNKEVEGGGRRREAGEGLTAQEGGREGGLPAGPPPPAHSQLHTCTTSSKSITAGLDSRRCPHHKQQRAVCQGAGAALRAQGKPATAGDTHAPQAAPFLWNSQEPFPLNCVRPSSAESSGHWPRSPNMPEPQGPDPASGREQRASNCGRAGCACACACACVRVRVARPVCVCAAWPVGERPRGPGWGGRSGAALSAAGTVSREPRAGALEGADSPSQDKRGAKGLSSGHPKDPRCHLSAERG